jgi:hypothetical protein
MNEWIMRIMPLPMPDRVAKARPGVVDLARLRLRIIAPQERPGARVASPRQCALDVGPLRILGLDSANPHGGVGGSFDTEQCAWLVRELERARDRFVVLVSHDGSRTLTSDANVPGQPPRVRGEEVVSMLLARPQVIAWIAGTSHERSGRRHGDLAHGFWEIPGATTGYGAPLAGGLSVTLEDRHLHRVISMRGVLTGDSGPTWDLREPLAGVSAEVLQGLAAR